MSIFLDKDPGFDTNDYFHSRCKIETMRMHAVANSETCFSRNTNGEELGFAKSLVVNLTAYPERLKEQYNNAITSLEQCIYTARSMGYEVYVKELNWHNIKDSCYNICGDKGFFSLTFRYVKKPLNNK